MLIFKSEVIHLVYQPFSRRNIEWNELKKGLSFALFQGVKNSEQYLWFLKVSANYKKYDNGMQISNM